MLVKEFNTANVQGLGVGFNKDVAFVVMSDDKLLSAQELKERIFETGLANKCYVNGDNILIITPNQDAEEHKIVTLDTYFMTESDMDGENNLYILPLAEMNKNNKNVYQPIISYYETIRLLFGEEKREFESFKETYNNELAKEIADDFIESDIFNPDSRFAEYEMHLKKETEGDIEYYYKLEVTDTFQFEMELYNIPRKEEPVLKEIFDTLKELHSLQTA